MAGVTIQVDDAGVRQALGTLLARVQDPQPALRSLGEALLNSTKARFRAQRGPDGAAWKPNSDVTLLRYLTSRKGTLSKRKTATGGRTLTQKGAKALGAKAILYDRGRLFGTLRYQVSRDSLAVGTDRRYGAMMQFGGSRTQYPHLWGDIPARPYLGLSAADRDTTLAIFRRFLLPR